MNYDELLKVDSEKRNLPYLKIVELEKNLPTKQYTFSQIFQMFPHLKKHILEVYVGSLLDDNVKAYYDVHYNDETYMKLANKKVISIYVTDDSKTNTTSTSISLESDIEENNYKHKSVKENLLKFISF